MKYFPLNLNLKNQTVMIIGGGQVALRKAELLLKAGAHLIVVAPHIDATLLQSISTTPHIYLEQPYQSDLLAKYKPRLIIAATNEYDVNQQVFNDAELANIICNTVDIPALSRAIFPAIVNRDPVMVSISTSGASPTFARHLRGKIEALLPQHLGGFAEWISHKRTEIKHTINDIHQRQRFWDMVLDSNIMELYSPDDLNPIEQYYQTALKSFITEQSGKVGQAYIIGVGPGDPELLTLKALRLMQKVDVVVYDRLVSPEIMELVRRDAKKIYVGKQRDQHTLPQEEINQLLVKLAKQGLLVARLKGGDPFIFGRGGEEVAELIENNVSFEVVPGITAGSGCATYAGIPLTHRDVAQSVRFITAHLKDGSPELPWHELIFPYQTLVLYMGLFGLEHTINQLMTHGLPADWPIAIISKGTTQHQKNLFGRLNTIIEQLKNNPMQAPAIVILGQVVTLAPDWSLYGN